ncbi:hypothetical protein DPMN_058002 [Dreissena polymorpha]|uniref:Uncharacterized protein n=1 Tax=Dreissena polymorpha TaxID=45954 RepID=A0A9D4HFM6_DREPO|nr:hypothetical protein DPMN_058002 [Dreissena polymorpha]
MLVKQKAQEAWKKYNASRKTFSYPKAPGAGGAEESDTPDANPTDINSAVHTPWMKLFRCKNRQ